jgi:hypothetical protein
MLQMAFRIADLESPVADAPGARRKEAVKIVSMAIRNNRAEKLVSAIVKSGQQ